MNKNEAWKKESLNVLVNGYNVTMTGIDAKRLRNTLNVLLYHAVNRTKPKQKEIDAAKGIQ